jgi:pimeloyl-ACP methyl ester carboxylesterase
MADHAADVVSLMDSVKLCDAVVGGHSFGGLLTLYMAAQYPERVSKLILLDSSGQIINPTSRSLIKPSLDRLGQTFPSWESYLDSIKAMPFYAGWWDPLIENYYRADVEYAIDGSVRPRSKREHISEAIDRAADEPWGDHIRSINQPAVLIRAPEGFGPAGSKPIVPLDHAMATVDALDDCRYVEAPGNHMTMLYGEGAREIVTCITEFISE